MSDLGRGGGGGGHGGGGWGGGGHGGGWGGGGYGPGWGGSGGGYGYSWGSYAPWWYGYGQPVYAQSCSSPQDALRYLLALNVSRSIRATKIGYDQTGRAFLHVAVTTPQQAANVPASICGYPVVVTAVGAGPFGLGAPATAPAGAVCPTGTSYDSSGSCVPPGNVVPAVYISPSCTDPTKEWSPDDEACIENIIDASVTPASLPSGTQCPGSDASRWQYMTDGLCHSTSTASQVPEPQLPVVASSTGGGATSMQNGGGTQEKSSVLPYVLAGSIAVVAVGLVFATLAIKPPPPKKTQRKA